MLKGNSTVLPLETLSSSLATEYRNLSPVEPSEHHLSQLSSPFMSKPSITERAPNHRLTPRFRSHSLTPEPLAHADEIFSNSGSRNQGSVLVPLPTSVPSPPHTPSRPLTGAQRFRQATTQGDDIHPPKYIEREKPTDTSEALGMRERDREAGVSIMETPVKGRRLKIFQETSEESFEESLMAGGYGRYRTADWVRQPQPILLATPGAAGPSSVVSALERSGENIPPTQNDVKKRKRLAAFSERTNSNRLTTKLHPVELEGRGRVIIDAPVNDGEVPAVEGHPSKKKPATRRKKKGEVLTGEKKGQASTTAVAEDPVEKPNWPDAEFPWRLRSEERADALKAEEAERLKWIERFLDHLSDEEDEDEDLGNGVDTGTHRLYGGKTVINMKNPRGSRSQTRQRVSSRPDSADALAALVSKEKIRNPPYLKKLRLPEDSESDGEVVCICNGKDDGRELVQCDACETWYHLGCIGIRDVSELGKEEDPWFCHHCKQFRRLSSSQLELSSEPTFVPTEVHPDVRASYDTPFFQPVSLQASPLAWDHSKPPRTPTRNRDAEHELSSGSSWPESRIGPSTPQTAAEGVSMYHRHTPGPFDNYAHPFPFEESPFDPTSTPSRGIGFNVPFATPKNAVWHARSNSVFQTPTAGSGRSSLSKSSGTFSSSLDSSEIGTGGYSRVFSDDESPVRRVRSNGRSKARRPTDSPLALRSTMPVPYHLLESPIMHSGDTYKRRDFSHGSIS